MQPFFTIVLPQIITMFAIRMCATEAEKEADRQEELAFWAHWYRVERSDPGPSKDDLIKANYWLEVDRQRRSGLCSWSGATTQTSSAIERTSTFNKSDASSRTHDVEKLRSRFEGMRLRENRGAPTAVSVPGYSSGRLTMQEIAWDFAMLPPDPVIPGTQIPTRSNEYVPGPAVSHPVATRETTRTTAQPVRSAWIAKLQKASLMAPRSQNDVTAAKGVVAPCQSDQLPAFLQRFVKTEPLSRQAARRSDKSRQLQAYKAGRVAQARKSAEATATTVVKLEPTVSRRGSFSSYFEEPDDDDTWTDVAVSSSAGSHDDSSKDTDNDDEEYYQTARKVVQHSPQAVVPPPVSAAQFADNLKNARTLSADSEKQQQHGGTQFRSSGRRSHIYRGITVRAAADLVDLKSGDGGVKKGDGILVLESVPADGSSIAKFVGKNLRTGVVGIFPESKYSLSFSAFSSPGLR